RFRRRSLRAYPRGMGVLVVFCSFLALSMGPGLLNAYGVYEEEYDRLFDSKDERHSWSSALGSPVIFIGVIQIFVANGLGFIGGQSAQRFGPGPSVFLGGLLMAGGLFMASFVHEVWQLCLTQGLVFGLGVCLTWIPAASAPSSWFVKNRGLATGITHMGLGIGGLVFAPVTRFLLEKSGTSGSLRWLALVMLVGVSVASLGIHSKHHEERMSEIVVSSARWSRCMEDTGLEDSDLQGDECPGDPEMRAQDGDEEAAVDAIGEGQDAGSKHVRFAPELARQQTLDKLEGGRIVRVGQRRAPRAHRANRNRARVIDGSDSKPVEPEKRLLQSWRFWLLSLGIGVGQASWYIVLLFITSISVSVGLDVHNAAILLGAINGASAVGQFAAGYAADLVGPVNSLVAFTLVATLSNTILFVPRLSFHLLLAYACVCGMSIGAADPLAVIAGVTQFGRKRAATTTGLVYGSVGALVTVSAPVARVVQQTGMGFRHVYVVVLGLFAVSTLLLVLLRLRISRKLVYRA
ncbi:hypothetical protein H4S02_004845, partial [Coemansia sp. RSA 2611]